MNWAAEHKRRNPYRCSESVPPNGTGARENRGGQKSRPSLRMCDKRIPPRDRHKKHLFRARKFLSSSERGRVGPTTRSHPRVCHGEGIFLPIQRPSLGAR